MTLYPPGRLSHLEQLSAQLPAARLAVVYGRFCKSV